MFHSEDLGTLLRSDGLPKNNLKKNYYNKYFKAFFYISLLFM